MWSLKFSGLVNSVAQIVHGKRNGLLECCCRTCRSYHIWMLSCLNAKVNGQNRQCTRCSVVPHIFLCSKKCLLLKCFPQVGQDGGYVTFGMIIRVTSNKVLSESTCFVMAMTSISFSWEQAGLCYDVNTLPMGAGMFGQVQAMMTNSNSMHGVCSCAINQL